MRWSGRSRRPVQAEGRSQRVRPAASHAVGHTWAACRCAARWGCSCGTTASAWACSTPWRVSAPPPRATTACARPWAACTARAALSWRRAARHRGVRADHVSNRVDSLSWPTTAAARTTPSCRPSSAGGRPVREDRVLLQRRPRPAQQRRPRHHHRVSTPRPAMRSTGAAAGGQPRLELGARTEALPGLQSSLALWKLDFDSELVYIGDAGATEASAASRRRGVEFNNRWTAGAGMVADRRRPGLDACPLRQRRPHPQCVDRVASLAATVRDSAPGRPACSGATWAAARWWKTTACAAARRSPPTCASAGRSAPRPS
jgi:hypothetical protein